MTSRFSRFGVPLLLGAVLGVVGWSLIAPNMIAWWYEPPLKDALSCAPSVRRAIGDFLKVELFAAAGSGLLAAVLTALIRRRLAARSAERGGV